MNILYILPLLSTVGGQERTLTDKANWLAHQGHQVLMVTYEHEGPLAYPLDDGVRHEDLCCHFFSLYSLPLYRRPWAALKMKRQFRERLTILVKDFRPDVIVVAIPNTENFLSDIIQVAGDIPVIIESHLAHGHQVIRRGFTEKWLYYIFSPQRAIAKARLLIALTEGDAAYWKGIVQNVKVIPNPLPSAFLPDTAHRKHQTTSCHRVIAVGRLAPQKRMDRLIDAFAQLSGKYPEWTLDIFGQGECYESLLQQIHRLQLTDRIRLLPPTRHIAEEYEKSDSFVLSSDYEGFGLVIIEAMACGLPVVATDCPYGPSEIIEDGKTGLLSQLNVQDLAAKIEWIITHKKEREEMGFRAHEASVRYHLEQVAPQWLAAYQSANNR